ncbi:hypothetical protein MMC07_001753 [Pseudocyphellaria aurata]|nr:hypothetical protein [Pseudocyphellaria aurata]
MEKASLTSLPAELQVSIATYLDKYDLMSLCQSSPRLNQKCVVALYRHVDLLFDSHGHGMEFNETNLEMWDALLKRQRQFVQTLLSHPEYGRFVRSLKGRLCIFRFNDYNSSEADGVSEKDLWRAMQSLSRVKSVDLAANHFSQDPMTVLSKDLPTALFRTATSVRLVGYMQYDLAKSILSAINPAMLLHLCLDIVQDRKPGQAQSGSMPGDIGEDGRIIALGATAGLLTILSGRCTALRTLVLRRIGQNTEGDGWETGNTAAEEASYIEWAIFVSSVKGTVEKFTYEQSGQRLRTCPDDIRPASRIMDRRFRQLILPAIISGNWPCLKIVQIRGVRRRDSLRRMLKSVLGRDVEIELEEEARLLDEYREPNRWN